MESEIDLAFVELMAELGFVLAGFSVLVFALRQSAGPRGLLRSVTTTLGSFVVGFVALVPQLLAGFGFREAAVWGLSSIVAALAFAAVAGWGIRTQGQMTRLGWPRQSPRSVVVAFGFASLAILLSALNATGWLWAPHGAVFGCALASFMVLPALAMTASFWIELRTVFTDAGGKGESERS